LLIYLIKDKVEMAKLLGVGRATLYRWIKLYEEKRG